MMRVIADVVSIFVLGWKDATGVSAVTIEGGLCRSTLLRDETLAQAVICGIPSVLLCVCLKVEGLIYELDGRCCLAVT